MEWDTWVSKCKLLYLRWINNKVLLYRTGNYIQYPVINNNGKEYKIMKIKFRTTKKSGITISGDCFSHKLPIP